MGVLDKVALFLEKEAKQWLGLIKKTVISGY
jgi:hypothetical protein